MTNSDSGQKEEIDLFYLFVLFWNNKWKMICFPFIGCVFIYSYQIIKPQTVFNALTTIKPITSDKFIGYRLYNGHVRSLMINLNQELDYLSNKDDENDTNNKLENKKINEIDIFKKKDTFFEIKPELLLNLYIEQLEEGTIFEEAIKKFNLIEKENFSNQKDFEDAIVKLASEIKIIPPENVTENSTQILNKYHTIMFRFNNVNKWKQVLTHVLNQKDEIVRMIIKKRFDAIYTLAEQKRKFELEDIHLKINNEVKNYDNEMTNKIAYLTEQAAIARKLGIKKNTLSTQTINSNNRVFTNVCSDKPFFLVGYEALEEEIKLIESRTSKKNYIPNILKLEKRRHFLKNDKSLYRIKELFENTPIINDNFKPVSIKVASTSYTVKNNILLQYSVAIIFGSMIAVLYILLLEAINRRKTSVKI